MARGRPIRLRVIIRTYCPMPPHVPGHFPGYRVAMTSLRLPRLLPLAAVATLAVLVLAACGSSGSSGSTSEGASGAAVTPATELAGTTWNLSSYAGADGADVAAVTSPTVASLTFGADGTWSGSTGCNRIAGSYTQSGQDLTMAAGPMTKMACTGPVVDQEAAIIANLPQVASFTADTSLVLLSSDGTALLTYAPGLTDLAGTSWTATGINNGKEAVVAMAGTEKATLVFGSDGQVSGSGGCNSFSGTYTTTEPDGLTFGPLAATEKACLDGDAMQIEQEYFAALANVTTYQLEGATLTLRDAAGATQVSYVQAP
jgi:heat shock protein HslJ